MRKVVRMIIVSKIKASQVITPGTIPKYTY